MKKNQQIKIVPIYVELYISVHVYIVWCPIGFYIYIYIFQTLNSSLQWKLPKSYLQAFYTEMHSMLSTVILLNRIPEDHIEIWLPLWQFGEGGAFKRHQEGLTLMWNKWVNYHWGRLLQNVSPSWFYMHSYALPLYCYVIILHKILNRWGSNLELLVPRNMI